MQTVEGRTPLAQRMCKRALTVDVLPRGELPRLLSSLQASAMSSLALELQVHEVKPLHLKSSAAKGVAAEGGWESLEEAYTGTYPVCPFQAGFCASVWSESMLE